MQTDLQDVLFALEEQFWKRGPEFYGVYLADAAIMVFPDPAGVMVKDEVATSLAKSPRWSDVALEEHRVMQLSDAAAVVTYKATAVREGEPRPYVARASSAYVRDGRAWKLAFHQQTPLRA